MPDPFGEIAIVTPGEQTFANANRDIVRIERALDRKKPVPEFVLRADAKRLIGGAVKLFAHLHFNERALLFHHDDEFKPLREFFELALAQRPRATDLEKSQAEIIAPHLVDAELIERLADV